jgi:hypothetical protein
MSHSTATFSETDLAELDGVFEDVCAAVNATGELDEGTRGAIRRRLFVLACNGMTNPKAMRHHLILNFSRSKTRSSARERLANGPKLGDPG